MKYPTLPQVCCRCRKFKSPQQGRFTKSRHKYSRWLWLCAGCEENSIRRENRQGKESRYEKIVREALQAVFRSYHIRAERRVGPYIFDFAVEDLRLLIEIDPHSTHSAVNRKICDWKKSKLAREQGWTLVRLNPFPMRKLAKRALNAVKEHYRAMFAVADQPKMTRKALRRNEAPTDKLIRCWKALFHRLYGFEARFTSADTEALDEFFEEYPQASTDKIVKLFWTAWNVAKERPAKYPDCTGATSMKLFFDNIWSIGRELDWSREDILDGGGFTDEGGREICDPTTTTWTAIRRVLEGWVTFDQPERKPEERWLEAVIERLEADKNQYLIHREHYEQASQILKKVGLIRADAATSM